jgi:hypothetical protein
MTAPTESASGASEVTDATQPGLATTPERLPGEPEAIFVVGVPRSGTTMMRTILDTSDRIAIARENHYMGHVFGRRGARHFFRKAGTDLTSDDTIRKIVDMIYSGEYERLAGWRPPSPHWYWLLDNMDRQDLENRLLAAERTERGMFRAFISAYADKKGKPIWGEKTPTHLNFADELLEWFPDAKIVHMLRDPRAIYVSDRYRRQNRDRWPYTWMDKVPLLLEAYLLVLTVVTWRSALRLHAGLKNRHPDNYRLVRFEDVVVEPDRVLPEIFGFLGVAVPEDVKSVGLAARHGMRSSDEGIDPKAASRWRERIHPVAKRFIEVSLGRSMRKNGYTA